MKRIKILETIRQGHIGGGETHLYELVTHMDLARFEPIVLSFSSGDMVDKLKQKGIKVKVIYTEHAFDFKIWKKVRDFIIEEQIDIVHAHGTRAYSNIFLHAKMLKLPVIYTVHGWSFHIDQTYLTRKMRELSENLLTALADTTICVSKSNQQDGIDHFNMKRSTVIHNAIDLNKYNPKNQFNHIRNELGISSDQIVVGYIQRITKQKDPLTMLHAMKKVFDRSDKIRLLMVGDGDLKSDSIKLAKELMIDDRVIFQDFRTDIPDVLNAIDIYCLPSLWEGFPIGILEAMAIGKAVVATAVDGTREMIDDGTTGLLIEHGKPQDLADALLLLSNDFKLRKLLADNAIKYVNSNFGIQRLVAEVEKVYKQLVRTGYVFDSKEYSSFMNSLF